MEKEPAKRPLSAKAVAESLQLIKDKVATQKSAGVDAATKRKIDRARGDKKLDEEDKAAARVMLGKKKKAKTTPFYAKGWFTILALTMVAVLVAVGVYFAFVRVPDAEALYSSAETTLRSDKAKAREGPIADFLRYYPGHAKSGQVKAWADQIDFELLEKQMYIRRNGALKLPPTAEEITFNKALDFEKEGKLPEAAALWEELSAKKGNADAESHVWGVLGERYAKDHRDADALLARLKIKAVAKDAKGEDKFEQASLEALQSENDQQFAQAKNRWDDLTKMPDAPPPLASTRHGPESRHGTQERPGKAGNKD